MSDVKSFFSDHPLFILDHNTLDILDANNSASEFYGYTYQEFCNFNISDLGERKERSELIAIDGENDLSNDKIWIHHTKKGEKVYVQFTSHTFNYEGKPAKLAVAHDVTLQVKQQETRVGKFPQIKLFEGDRALAEISWDEDHRVTQWSDKAEDLFGWSKDEVIGKDDFFEEFVHDDELDEAYRLIEDNIDDLSRSYKVNGRVCTREGDVRVCEWHNTLAYDEAGDLQSIYSLVQDISDRKESEYLFKALSEESLVGVYLIQDDIFKYINPRFAEIFNYSKAEVEDTLGPLDLTHPEDSERVANNLDLRINGEADSIQYDFRCLTKDQKTIHVKVFGTRIDYLGKPAVVGTLLDITHSKLAFERYQASLESFEDLFDSISDAIYILDEDSRFIEVNKSAEKLTGYKRDYLIGKTPDDLAAPGKSDPEENRRYFEKALNGKTQQFEGWSKRKNGEVFPEEVILNRGTYFGSKVVIAISRDISARYEIEDIIQKTEEKFRQLFKNSPFGIVMMDKHQEIREVNAAFEHIFGYQAHEIAGLDIDQLIVPEDEENSARRFSQKIFTGDTSSIATKRRHKDGSLIDVLVYGVPVNVDEETVAIYGIYVDITERKQAEEKVKKSLKEKEVLLAEIHHRVKNNLAVITGLLELQQHKTDSFEAKDILKESQLRINSIALIHEKLYQNENLSEISIDVYLQELIDIIVASMTTENTDVDVAIDAECVPLTITQAIPCGLILNELVTNAYKHAFDGRDTGRIDISLTQNNDTFYMQFSDDGRGIPEDIDMNKPTTLGLTLIKTLSKQLKGTYSFENDGGMLFTLQFKQGQ